MVRQPFKEIDKKTVIKYLFLSLTVVMVVSLCLPSRCEAKAKKEKPLTTQQRKALIREAKDELDGTTWEITLREMATIEEGKKRKEREDTLYFKDRRIESEEMNDEGFSPTNYSVRVKGRNNEIIVWETMQTSEAKGVAFWRGEIIKGSKSMRGVLSWHISDNKKKDFSFRGTAKEPEPEEEEMEAAEAGGEAGQVAAKKEEGLAQEVKKEVAKGSKAQEEEPKKEEPKKEKPWWKR